MMRSICALALATAVCVATTAGTAQESTAMPTLAELQKMTLRFAPAEIGTNVSALPAGERAALGRLIEASRIMDALFLRQVWGGNDAMLQDLARLAAAPVAPRAIALSRCAPALFPHQQGSLGSTGPQPRVRPGRAGQAGVGELLSRRCHEGRRPEMDRFALPAKRKRPPPDSSPRSAAATSTSSSCRTASSTRESWRAPPSSFATRRSSRAMRR